MKKNCITLICDFKYRKFLPQMINSIRNIGKFKGDIVLITNSQYIKYKFQKINKVNTILYPKVPFKNSTNKLLKNIPDGRFKKKYIQWYKIYLFDQFFKQWKYNLFLDVNMKINNEINFIFELPLENKLYAPYDAYPNLDWKLETQFAGLEKIIEKLRENYNLDDKKYFQTGILLYDTNIINKNLINELIQLVNDYPVAKNNEQGIFNLYFKQTIKVFEPLPKTFNKISIYNFWHNIDNPATITKKTPKN